MKIRIKTKYKAFEIYLYLIALMPLVALLQDVLPAINKVTFMFIFVFQILVIINRLTPMYTAFLSIALLTYVISAMNTSGFSYSNNMLYYINWLLYVGTMCLNYDKMKNWIRDNKRYIYTIIILWNIAVGISIFIPSCYFVKEAGARYFGSYVGSTFRLAPTALFIEIMVLNMIILFENKKSIVFMIVPMYCGFMGGSRTYFLILTIVMIIAVFVINKNKYRFFATMIPIALIGFAVFRKSAIFTKTMQTTDENMYGDNMTRFTSSRNIIWSDILHSFSKLNIYEKFFGAGFGFSNRVTSLAAHNDFIEILVTYGYLGLILYVFSVVILIYVFIRRKTISKIILVLSILVWLINASANMFCYYICAALSFPFLLCAVVFQGEKIKIKKETEKKHLR